MGSSWTMWHKLAFVQSIAVFFERTNFIMIPSLYFFDQDIQYRWVQLKVSKNKNRIVAVRCLYTQTRIYILYIDAPMSYS